METEQNESHISINDRVVEKLKETRCLLKLIEVKRASRELSLTITKLDEAILWFSKVGESNV